MVEKFQIILNTIRTQRGDVTLFGVFKMDEFTDKWSVLLSATWATDQNRTEVFGYLRNLLRINLTPEESAQIARIGVFPVTEHLIDILLNYQTGSRIQEQAVNGNVIHDGHVLASNRSGA